MSIPGGLPPADVLFEQAACGLLVTSVDGTIRRANQIFCDWIGQDEAAFVDVRKFQDLLTVGGRIFHQTHWEPLLQLQGAVAEVQLQLTHRDGHPVAVLLNAVRREQRGAVRHDIAVFRSEDRRRYEQELIQARTRVEQLLVESRDAQQALAAAQQEVDRQRDAAQERARFAEQMVGIVGHDLRNPLTAIRFSAQLIGRGDLSPEQQRSLEGIQKSAARAQRITADLLDFTEARFGIGVSISASEADLHAVVAECVEELRLTFPLRELVHVRSGPGTCSVDEARLARLLGNLVANAAAYGDPACAITIASRTEAADFSVSVHNHGAPLPQDRLATLFEPMTRGVSTAANSNGSIGLGLFIVREIARSHGGDVQVQSSAAHGTTFTATFPQPP